MVKRIFLFLGAALFVLIGVLLFNTFSAKSVQPTGAAIKPIAIDAQKAAGRLSEAVKFATISDTNFYVDTVFDGFNAYLKQTYPDVFAALALQTFGKHAFLLTWQGSNPALKPLLFLGHTDVVPVEEATLPTWEEAPFGGKIANGFIWGRGAIDDKSTVLGLLEATSALLKQGFKPERTIYLSFGADEEIGGRDGAVRIAEFFRKNNISFEAISDEGTLLTQNIVPGITNRPVALIGISEKGYLSVKLSCKIAGGHSSMPAAENAVSVLTNALYKLNNNPFPNKLSEPINGFITYMGPEMPFAQKLAFSNSTLLKSLIFSAYQKTPSGQAMIHTTMTPTILKAGIKDNVVPTLAEATLNLRILPGETVEGTLEYLAKTIADERVVLTKIDGAANPSSVSNYKNEAFTSLGLALKDVYPDALVTPFLMLGATDSRHFEGLSDNIYKFMPVLFESEDLARFHGANERVSIANFEKAIQIYAQCMVRWSGQTK